MKKYLILEKILNYEPNETPTIWATENKIVEKRK